MAAVWADYVRTDTSLIFVVDSTNIGQVGLVGVKLCQCLQILQQKSADTNQVMNHRIVDNVYNVHVTGL